MSICYTPKNFEVSDRGLPSTPSFFRCLITNTFSWTPVQNINSSGNSFCPEFSRHLLCFQHASYHIHDGSVLSLSNSILLRRVSCCHLMLDSMLLKEISTSKVFLASICS